MSETNTDSADTIVYRLQETNGAKKKSVTHHKKKPAQKMSEELLAQCKDRMQAWGALPSYETK